MDFVLCIEETVDKSNAQIYSNQLCSSEIKYCKVLFVFKAKQNRMDSMMKTILHHNNKKKNQSRVFVSAMDNISHKALPCNS